MGGVGKYLLDKGDCSYFCGPFMGGSRSDIWYKAGFIYYIGGIWGAIFRVLGKKF